MKSLYSPFGSDVFSALIGMPTAFLSKSHYIITEFTELSVVPMSIFPRN